MVSIREWSDEHSWIWAPGWFWSTKPLLLEVDCSWAPGWWWSTQHMLVGHCIWAPGGWWSTQNMLKVHELILFGHWSIGRWASTKHLLLWSRLGLSWLWAWAPGEWIASYDWRWTWCWSWYLILSLSWSCGVILRVSCWISLRACCFFLLLLLDSFGRFFLEFSLVIVSHCFVHSFWNFLKNGEAFVHTCLNLRLIFLNLVDNVSSDTSGFLCSLHELLYVKVKINNLSLLNWWCHGLNLISQMSHNLAVMSWCVTSMSMKNIRKWVKALESIMDSCLNLSLMSVNTINDLCTNSGLLHPVVLLEVLQLGLIDDVSLHIKNINYNLK